MQHINKDLAIKSAMKWRSYLGYQGKGGIVLVFDGEAYAWRDKVRNPETERPNALAVDEAGNVWIATGGDDYNGAERWEAVEPEEASADDLPSVSQSGEGHAGLYSGFKVQAQNKHSAIYHLVRIGVMADVTDFIEQDKGVLLLRSGDIITASGLVVFNSKNPVSFFHAKALFRELKRSELPSSGGRADFLAEVSRRSAEQAIQQAKQEGGRESFLAALKAIKTGNKAIAACNEKSRLLH